MMSRYEPDLPTDNCGVGLCVRSENVERIQKMRGMFWVLKVKEKFQLGIERVQHE